MMDQVNLQGWVGRQETQTGQLSTEILASWHATIADDDTPGGAEGDIALPLSHWTAFNPTASMAALGEDGHPKLGGFLPPLDLPRRMWAGGALSFHQPLRVGDALERQTTLRSIEEKTGAAGRMVFVKLEHEIFGPEGLAISERQDIVYLPMPERFVPPKKIAAPEAPDRRDDFLITTPRLFRFSAVTFNAHRIHYDLPYTQDTEKYPGLVVHGPLQATALIHLAMRYAGRAPDGFRFRSVHPMFHDDDLHLNAIRQSATEMHLSTSARTGGHVGMQATATWEVAL